MVQENYLNHVSHIANNDETLLSCAAKAAELISDGDIVKEVIRCVYVHNAEPTISEIFYWMQLVFNTFMYFFLPSNL